MAKVVERFAPSPTGELHLGHAFSALVAWGAARAQKGAFLLRMEDLDTGRVRPEFDSGIREDLAWIGVDWDGPVLVQSARLPAYEAAIAALDRQGLLYACTCTRRDIAAAVEAPQEGGAQLYGPDGLVYPGTCRARAISGAEPAAIRLDMAKAIEALGGDATVNELGFEEIGAGPEGERGTIRLSADILRRRVGDVVLKRKDGAPAYHLAVVVDDSFQGVTHVTRGEDLFSSTQVHRVLQALLGLPMPIYRHHRLIRDDQGQRLAKRNKALSLAQLRAEGVTPPAIRQRVGL